MLIGNCDQLYLKQLKLNQKIKYTNPIERVVSSEATLLLCKVFLLLSSRVVRAFLFLESM